MSGHLSHLIDGAVPGSDNKVPLYVLGSDWLAGRLVSAHERGVNVQVILDDRSLKHYAGSGAYAKLAEGLARRTGTPGTSWLRVCMENTACLAKDPNPQDGFHNVNHNKFSRTTGNAAGTVPVDDVVVQTSANQTAWDRQRAWNDAMTVAENPALYAAYAGYFADLAAAQADPAEQVSTMPSRTRRARPRRTSSPGPSRTSSSTSSTPSTTPSTGSPCATAIPPATARPTAAR
ncbi:phospholipase D family protein [Streptomyces peucetius]|uniref:Phospholipase D family protein n=1 Tax=Streptomyces peucetius TaxID=1950 RepID=A0ABY6ICE5_STRPE|nr:phospholipase D family protein [Streptomyces peucetius]UYQ64389.1 phospholipase D family protein [Streptomyces peucetius]